MSEDEDSNFEKIDSIFYSNIRALWQLNIITECYKQKMSIKDTMEYLRETEDFTLEVFLEYNKHESGNKMEIKN